jgi:L-ascorbate metabolism protein UlaG (beta-lactamase superfamily)
MKLKVLFSFLLFATTLSVRAQRTAPDQVKVSGGELTVQPINHATFVLTHQHKNIYVDPTGGAAAFQGLAAPDMILITDIHGDHFDPKTIEAIQTAKTMLIVPQAVAETLPATTGKERILILKNGDQSTQGNVKISAVPMYNRADAENANYHIKGRGNGYILEIGGKRVYISGDTADTPEMRALKNIDVAFVCMNLPYTMDVNEAAAAVLAFKPKVVYPYHYRGQDVAVFNKLVGAGNKQIEVRLRDWYAEAK